MISLSTPWRKLAIFSLVTGMALLLWYALDTKDSVSTKILKRLEEIESQVANLKPMLVSPMKEDSPKPARTTTTQDDDEPVNFEGFDNVTGADHFIVPNIIHFVRFHKVEYSFVDYLCLKAALRNHRPEYFYIHTDVGDKFTGKYWDWIQQDFELKSRIKIIHLDLPQEIFGQKFNPSWHFHHGSDVSRIRLLMKYGGIYLDNDVFVIKSLDKYRKFEIAMNWDEGQFIGNQVFVTHKDARFLKLYLESYRGNYQENKWYYNAGERPTVEILYHHPELLHRVKGNFGAATGLSSRLYTDPNLKWRELDAIHLLMGHRYYMDPHYNETENFDENNIRNYNYGAFGEMAREIMDFE